MAKVLWTQKQDIGPRPRAGHAMAYDATRGRVVLFGGDTLAGARLGDTWEWDGDSWTQLQDIGPAPRAFHAMAFDSLRNRTVLFGGRGADGRLGDTWEWDGADWTQVADSGPSRRSGHAMAFDSQRQRIVLFGGESDEEATRFNDTWEWDGNEWVQQADSGPSARVHAAMAFDSTRNRLVLFGGAAENAGLGDTWEWDGTAWTEEANFGPDACAAAAMVFKGTRVALFGGISSIVSAANLPQPSLFSRSWEWNGRHWTARQDMGPGFRVYHAMAFDSARSRVVLFGGSQVPPRVGTANSVQGDTWEQFESGAASTQPPPATVTIAGVAVDPNPAAEGQPVTITVTLAGPAPADVAVEVAIAGSWSDVVRIPAQATEGRSEVPSGAGHTPGVYIVTARAGTSEASTQLTILPSVPVDIVGLTASPNPIAPGQTLTITVTLAGPVPEPTSVLITADQQPFGTIPIAPGAINGEIQLEIPAGTPTMTVLFRAESGGSQAETTLQINAP